MKFDLVKQSGVAVHFAVEHPDGVDQIFFGAIDSGEISFNGAAATIRSRKDQPASFAAVKTLTLRVAGKSLVNSPTLTDAEGNF